MKYKEPDNIGEPGSKSDKLIGGNQDDNPYAMEQGPDGNLYVTGMLLKLQIFLLSDTLQAEEPGIDQSGQTDNIL